jgi:hypothetical protein
MTTDSLMMYLYLIDEKHIQRKCIAYLGQYAEEEAKVKYFSCFSRSSSHLKKLEVVKIVVNSDRCKFWFTFFL